MEAELYFRRQARECRRLADDMAAREDKGAMLMLARHYEREAQQAAAAAPPPAPRARH